MESSHLPLPPPVRKSRRADAVGLLAGIVTGFLLAVLLGYQASTYSKPSNFVRFQPWTNTQGIFFPPFRMLEHLALNRWRPGQTVVIVAGNSIFNGVAQLPGEIWTQRLQEILGPEKYVVVNLSFVGSSPTEGGMLVAESLVRRGIPVVVVGCSGTGPPSNAISGFYRYGYWEARGQSALLPFPERDAALDGFLARLPETDRRAQLEMKRAGILNSHLYFQELWHHVALRYAFTVWNFLTGTEFWRPRDEWPDIELPPLPLEKRFRTKPAAELEITRGFSSLITSRDSQSRWQLTPIIATDTAQQIAAAYPPRLRPHLLMVLCQNAPFFRRQLTADELARDEAAWRDCAALWRSQGIACAINGLDFEDADYNDRTHLTASGGHKLATLVATELRKMNPESPRP